MLRFARLLVACALLAGCEVDPTQLVVVVQTDMASPGELDGFVVRVRDAGGRLVEPERAFALEGEPAVTLPATFGVAPKGGDPDRRVTVEVDAMLDGARRFATRARTGFIEGEALRLDLWLAGRCVAEVCEGEDRTCSLEGCIDVNIPPGDLPPWRPLDAGVADDAAVDGGAGGVATEVLRGDAVTVSDLVLDAEHAAVVTGVVTSGVDVDGSGDEPLRQMVGNIDLFVAKVDADGTRQWLTFLGSANAGIDRPRVGLSPDGSVIVFAWARGELSLCGDGASAPRGTMILAKLGPVDGDCNAVSFAEMLSPEAKGLTSSLATFGDGSLVYAGSVEGSVQFEGLTLVATEDGRNRAFGIAEEVGSPPCSIVAAGGASSEVLFAGPGLAGELLLAGDLFDAGETTVLDPFSATVTGVRDAFLLRSSMDCQPTALRTVSGELVVAGARALDDGSGQALLAGTAADGVSLGILSAPGIGGGDIFAARLTDQMDPADGIVVIGGAGTERALDAAAFRDGSLLVAGDFGGTTRLGDAEVAARGDTDGYVLALGPDLTVRWLHVLGGSGIDVATAIAWDAVTGELVVAGESSQGLSLGQHHLDPAPMGELVFVGRFVP